MIVALVGAAWWFFVQGQTRPRLIIKHRLSRMRISDERQILVVDAILSNVGNVPLDLKRGEVRVYEITPVDKRVVKDDDIDEMVIDPGESGQVYKEYHLGADVTSVRVDTYFRDPAQKSLGWELTTFYDMGNGNGNEAVVRAENTPHRRIKRDGH